MSWLKNFFTKNKTQSASTVDNLDFDADEKLLIKKFSKLNNDKRIRKVISDGDSCELKYYALLKYAIIHDPDINVKFAALKRIHLFKAHPDVVLMLKGLNEHINTRNLEPYYSMALSKVGIISLKEFEERINKPGR